ncbi:MAG: ATP-dependent Clp protease ATP-binding subunit [Schwartzia sp.]|nr:ATP-dependent Clp protease ATP-binding subunit [Schwartzia sp. (in: firmicutes)]MBR1885022.1 ATP-dependent Clp protease ATP-binding subunit [Schwartzia sp. (in: firmicutes)]
MSNNNQFTPHAIAALKFAQHEALERGRSHIGPEHLLLGLLHERESVAAHVLAELGVEFEEAEARVGRIVPIPEGAPDNPYYTPSAKRVMQFSVEEAHHLEQDCIGTEHILLALTRESSNTAARVLSSLGADLDLVRETVFEMVGEEDDEEHGDGGSGTPLLARYGRSLGELAAKGKLDPVIGREREIRRVIQILSRRRKNNPVLIGEPGVGKTAVVEGLAEAIAAGDVPFMLRDKRVVSLSMSNVVAGAKYRGEFEERLHGILKEIRRAGNIILFIDEMHTLIGAGGAEGSLDAANILKPALSRGEIQVIGATTVKEYRKYFEKDAALVRRFQTVLVEEPDADAAIAILRGLRETYEDFHKARITDGAIDAAVRLSKRYITDRFLPDKAIDLMDEAASKVRMTTVAQPDSVREAEKELDRLRAEKENAIESQEYERAALLRDEEGAVKKRLEAAENEWKESGKEQILVTEDDIAEAVGLWTGIPVRKIEARESERLLHLEKILKRRVVGQAEALSALSRAIRRARAGLKDPKRPIGSFLFLGPTGVGKTELAKALAEALFDSEDAIIRFDMSEYMEKFTVSRLVGAPPGYVGYEEGGQLTDAVRKKPYSIILLDEIEKAHPDVFNILLQVMEDGRLTDSQGRTADFKNTVIIMTSNVGASFLKDEGATMGFLARDTAEDSYERAKKRVMEATKNVFKPEFLNRLDETLVFHALGRDELSAIVDILLGDVRARLAEKDMKLALNPSVKAMLIDKGTDFKFGARPLKRAIRKLIEDPIAEKLLARAFRPGDTIHAKKAGDALEFARKLSPKRAKARNAAHAPATK